MYNAPVCFGGCTVPVVIDSVNVNEQRIYKMLLEKQACGAHLLFKADRKVILCSITNLSLSADNVIMNRCCKIQLACSEASEFSLRTNL